MRLPIFIPALLPTVHAEAAVLFSHAYNLTGLGRMDRVEFSTAIPLGQLTALSTVEIEMSHSYVGELVFTLESPTGSKFLLLDHDGLRTRVGAGNGLLAGTELYTLRSPTEAVSSVKDWNFTRYQPGGSYGAREWPAGSWEAGTWSLTLTTDDVSSSQNGVVGAVRISGVPVPEPAAPFLVSVAAGVFLMVHRRTRGDR